MTRKNTCKATPKEKRLVGKLRRYEVILAFQSFPIYTLDATDYEFNDETQTARFLISFSDGKDDIIVAEFSKVVAIRLIDDLTLELSDCLGFNPKPKSDSSLQAE